MNECKLSFSEIEWTPSPGGGRSKVVRRNDRQFRIVEIAKATYSAEVCLVGHIGYVIDGEMRMDFDDGSIMVGPGDASTVPNGVPHTPHPVSDRVTLFLTEVIR